MGIAPLGVASRYQVNAGDSDGGWPGRESRFFGRSRRRNKLCTGQTRVWLGHRQESC